MFSMRKPLLVVTDVDFAKEVLIKNFNHFRNRTPPPITMRPLNKGLTVMRGNEWKYTRNLLAPTFSTGKMKQMIPLIGRCADSLVKNLDKYCKDGEPVELKSKFGAYSLDCIASCAFGVDVDSQNNPDSPFVKHAKDANKWSIMDPMLILCLFIPSFGKVLDLFNYSVFPKEVMNFFFKETAEIIEMRRQEETPRTDFLQLMLNAHNVSAESGDDGAEKVDNDTGYYRKRGMTNDEIMSNSLTFFLGSYETTSTCLGFTAYLLATHPEIQDKVIQEVDSIVAQHGSVTYDALNQMVYLDMVFSECLRLYPPGTYLDRICEKDIIIRDIPINKGVTVAINLWVIQHDPEIYPEPDKFIPERYSTEEKANRPTMTWLPFGAGPRNCIGSRFALMESKMAIASILQHFTFNTCEDTEIPPVVGKMGGLAPPKGFTLKIKNRK
ncbi:cytochrome P450 3A24-like isoform X2 [Glandiceps talaboti]